MDRVDYIERNSLDTAALASSVNGPLSPARLFRFYHIKEISTIEKKLPQTSEKKERLLFEDILAGMQGSGIPVLFYLKNENKRISIYIGTWQDKPASLVDVPVDQNSPKFKTSIHELDVKSESLISLLKGTYGFTSYTIDNFSALTFPKSGLVLGMPSLKIEADQLLPLDRILQSLSNLNWQCLILAEPQKPTDFNPYYNFTLAELRQVQKDIQDRKIPDPASESYAEILKKTVKNLELGKSIGTWRTAVYLSGDESSYQPLCSIWKGIYSGENSVPTPIRVWTEPSLNVMISRLKFSEVKGTIDTDIIFRHPYEYQTILNSRQLSAYIHMPSVETPGIEISKMQVFDTVAPAKDAANKYITIGIVIQRKLKTTIPYEIDLDLFSSHAFIPGMTGAGKTTTIKSVLKEAYRNGVNFLVIESAKTEYRDLLNDPLFEKDLQIFTLGEENISPFRLNPFEVLPGITIAKHLDLLRSVFTASFGMFTPLPQILERCLHKIYEDKGWNLTYDSNHRLQHHSEDLWMSFPTISDLYDKVEEVMAQLGYDDKIRDDLRASLNTRINGLRIGGKGTMLDTRVSLPMDVILDKPTILELEGVGDDDDKAFIMGLLFIKLAEYRRTQKQNKQHILVIEEAHRLLSNVSKNNTAEESNPKAKAVETFTEILAEIRAYKQGVIIADQVPVKLSPDVIKNTNIKVVHRCVAKDDREVLAGAMAMNNEQAQSFSTLANGEAIAFVTGNDLPLHISINRVSDAGAGKTRPDDARVKKQMAHMKKLPAFDSMFRKVFPQKDFTRPESYIALNSARVVIDDKKFRSGFIRFLFAQLESETSQRSQLVELIRPLFTHMNDLMDKDLFVQSVFIGMAEWFSSSRGAAEGKLFRDTEELKVRLFAFLKMLYENNLTNELNSLRECIYKFHTRTFDPFIHCGGICSRRDGQPLMCLYRFSVQKLIDGKMKEQVEAFTEAYKQDRSIELKAANSSDTQGTNEADKVKVNLWANCEDVLSPTSGGELRRRFQLCYAQHLVQDLPVATQREILSKLNTGGFLYN